MRRSIVSPFALSSALLLSSSSLLIAQVDPPEVAPPPPPTPPASVTPSVQPVPPQELGDPTRIDPAAVSPAPFAAKDPAVIAVEGDVQAPASDLERTFSELALLAAEVERFAKMEPAPPNAQELYDRAVAAIRNDWRSAADAVQRLPDEKRTAYAKIVIVRENDAMTVAELRTEALRIRDRIAQIEAGSERVPAASAVPQEVSLKTKTVAAVTGELQRPADAVFPAEWGGEYDEAVNRYVFDDVIETRNAQGLVQVVPFRAEWAYVDRQWQLAFLRVNGEVSLERDLKSVIPAGERPALVYVETRPEANRVAPGARKAVSELKGAYLGYANFLEQSHVWTSDEGSTYRAQIVDATTLPDGVVVKLQPFGGEPKTVPLNRFSDADQELILAWMRERPQPSVPPTIEP